MSLLCVVAINIPFLLIVLTDTQNVSLCSMDCSNGDKCGGPQGFFSVYDSLNSKPETVSFSLKDVVSTEYITYANYNYPE